jgi:hypothetical protein
MVFTQYKADKINLAPDTYSLSESQIDDALSFIRKRLGYVNKKLQLQHKLNLYIEE